MVVVSRGLLGSTVARIEKRASYKSGFIEAAGKKVSSSRDESGIFFLPAWPGARSVQP
jgi:hypothetical protein